MIKRKDCISCRKEMGEESKKPHLDYKNKEWCIARSNRCEDACNWCYWYAWDNVCRVDTFEMLKSKR